MSMQVSGPTPSNEEKGRSGKSVGKGNRASRKLGENRLRERVAMTRDGYLPAYIDEVRVNGKRIRNVIADTGSCVSIIASSMLGKCKAEHGCIRHPQAKVDIERKKNIPLAR